MVERMREDPRSCRQNDGSAVLRTGRMVVFDRGEGVPMSLYTKSGDEGLTSLASGQRLSKADERVEAYGTVDELQAHLGLARAHVRDAAMAEDIQHVEERLFDAMAELADAQEARITEADIQWLEEKIDQYAPSCFSFVVPGENVPSAALHVARTVARRCERRIVSLSSGAEVASELLVFFNRVSDLCYAMACSAA